MRLPEYSQITEAPGLQITQEQLERIYHRYHFAKQFCDGKDLVEVACGSGIGLNYLASFSKTVIAGDIDEQNIAVARKNTEHNPRIKVQNFDAHQLPFPDGSCDVVLLYEAIYYLQYPEQFIDECWRILRVGGILIICSVNKDWKDFHSSPFTYRYFSVPDLFTLISTRFRNITVYGAFKTNTGLKAACFSYVKKAAINLNLIPGSLPLRAYLKRIFIGKTFPLPANLFDGITKYADPIPLSADKSNSVFKIIYTVSQK